MVLLEAGGEGEGEGEEDVVAKGPNSNQRAVPAPILRQAKTARRFWFFMGAAKQDSCCWVEWTNFGKRS